MKKLNVFSTLFVALTFFSCSSDDDSKKEVDYSALIIGEWNFKSQAVNGVNEEFPDECHKDFEYQTYKANGTYQQTEFENHSENGCEEVTPPAIGTWSVNDNILNLTSNGEDFIITLTKLDKNTMIWDIDFDYDGDGTLDKYTQELTRKN